jgi:hypothetical protein
LICPLDFPDRLALRLTVDRFPFSIVKRDRSNPSTVVTAVDRAFTIGSFAHSVPFFLSFVFTR